MKEAIGILKVKCKKELFKALIFQQVTNFIAEVHSITRSFYV